MRWEDERYVRLYTRDTPDWLALGWEARLVFYELLRKVDRAGVIPWGKSRERGLAVLLHLPAEIVERGIASLAADGCVVATDAEVMLPNFLEAQECTKSDALRKKEQRERERMRVFESVSDVTKRDDESRGVTDESRNVTDSHEPSRGVQFGHEVSLLTVPNQDKPNLKINAEESADAEDPASRVVSLFPSEVRIRKREDLAAVVRIFNRWCEMLALNDPDAERRELTAGRRTAIRARLREYSEEQLIRAVEGIFCSAWHVEQKQTELTKCFGSAEKIDRFLDHRKRAEALRGAS